MTDLMAQREYDGRFERDRYTLSDIEKRGTLIGSHSFNSPTPLDPAPIANEQTDVHPLPRTTAKSIPVEVYSNKLMLPQDGNHQEEKSMITAIEAGSLAHVVWMEGATLEIFYKRDGADFDPVTINLSNNLGDSVSPKIAVSGDNVHITWSDNSSGNFEILYRRSIDGGATFGPTINVSDNSGSSIPSAIAISGSRVFIVWEDNTPGNDDILYRRSTDGGASFTEAAKNLSSNAGVSVTPAIAAEGDNVHVVWLDNEPGNNEIFYRRSTNGGSTFPNIIMNLSSNVGISSNPAVAASANIVNVAWNDSTPGNFDILYRRSTDNGASFVEAIKNLSSNSGLSGNPAVAALGSNVDVAWRDDTGSPGINDILYRKSMNGGITFPNIIQNLSDNSGASNEPTIALLGTNVYVVWTDNTPGNSEIMYRPSIDNGISFDPTVTNLSTSTEDSSAPSTAAG